MKPGAVQMSIRDAVETALLVELFIVDNKHATRWMTHMKEYRASLAVAALRDEHGIETPLIDLYYFFSPLAHPNFLGAINVVSEVKVGEDQIMRLYHFGGVRNEGVIRQRLGLILVAQMIALHTLGKAFAGLDPGFSDWWPRVRAMPAKLSEAKVHVGIEEEERETSDATKQVFLKLRFEEFKAKYGRDEGGD